MRYEAPLDPALADELMDFWAPIFVEGIDLTREALLGNESPDARITVYTRRIDEATGRSVSCCVMLEHAESWEAWAK